MTIDIGIIVAASIIGVALFASVAVLAGAALAVAWHWRQVSAVGHALEAAHYQLDREAWEAEAGIPGGER